MKLNKIAFLVLAPLFVPSAMALDKSCMPMVAAGEARLKQAAWQSVTVINGNFRMEAIKVSSGFFTQVGGTWKKSPISFDDAEKAMLAQLKSGEIKISQCSSGAPEMLDGVAVYAFKSKIEMKGAPAEESTLYIGKADGLPYKQVGKSMNVLYKYKNVQAPKL